MQNLPLSSLILVLMLSACAAGPIFQQLQPQKWPDSPLVRSHRSKLPKRTSMHDAYQTLASEQEVQAALVRQEYAQEAPDPLQHPQEADGDPQQMTLEKGGKYHTAPFPGRTRQFGQESGAANVKSTTLSVEHREFGQEGGDPNHKAAGLSVERREFGQEMGDTVRRFRLAADISYSGAPLAFGPSFSAS